MHIIWLCLTIFKWYGSETLTNDVELVALAYTDKGKSIQSGGLLILLQAQNSFGEFDIRQMQF